MSLASGGSPSFGAPSAAEAASVIDAAAMERCNGVRMSRLGLNRSECGKRIRAIGNCFRRSLAAIARSRFRALRNLTPVALAVLIARPQLAADALEEILAL